MDQVEPQQAQPAPVAYNASHFPFRLIKIIGFFAVLILVFAGGYFFSKMNTTQTSNLSSNINTQTPISQPTQAPNPNFPIDPSSSAVKSLWILYSLSGVVDSINQVDIGNVNGFNIQISSPTGPVVTQTFFVSDKTTNIVSLDKNSKETKFDISTLKKGESIQLNYQVDIKNQSQAQITKLTIFQ